jgi:hypothetical protein
MSCNGTSGWSWLNLEGGMNTALGTIVGIAFLFGCTCSGQVSSTPPRHWTSSTTLDIGMGFFRLQLSNNSPEAIRREVVDTNTVRLIAMSSGLSDEDLATVQLVQKPPDHWIWLYQIGNSDRAFKKLSEQLSSYVRTREEGHTRAFVMAALTNRVQFSKVLDPDLRVLATNKPLLALSWLKKSGSGTMTNEGYISRWSSYTLTDGEISWLYVMYFKADGSLRFVDDSKFDAKENDPKYQRTIKEVEAEVDAVMKKNGSFGGFGSVHSFWGLKKQILKAKGIDWRSPAELNPNSNYD